MLALLFVFPAHASEKALRLLKQAKSEEDPIRKIEILDQALEDHSLKGDLLSNLFLERALAYKAHKDCFRAIQDFNSSMAHSRKSSPALIEKIHCLILLDQLDEANRILEPVLFAGPGNAHAYVLKGMIYEKEGFLSRAEDEYARALQYEPNSILALDMHSKALLKGGKPQQALEDVNTLTKLAAKDPEIFMTRARIHTKLKNYAAALADYVLVENLLPGDDRVLKEKIQVYFRTDQAHKALEALSIATKKRPDDVELLVLQARAYLLLKNVPNAQTVLKQALKKNTGYAPAYLYQGLVLRTEDPDIALANLNRALELDGSLVEAYKERARIFIDLNEPVRAATDLTMASRLDPGDGEIFALRGLTCIRRMLYDAAIADFTRALECLPEDSRILYDRAVTHFLKDDLQQSLADVNRLLQTKPDAGRALSLRGILNVHFGNNAQARADFDKSVSVSPHDPLVRNNRGFFLFKMGDYRSAAADFKRASTLDPDYATARYNLGLANNREESLNSREPISP
jgi:tetratricopeptide (TPR) repeat protein